jgi:RimJ/RimL family protein N-acetyltransferase
MIEIRTGRLLLRAFREEDLDEYAAMMAEPEVVRYPGTVAGDEAARAR